MTAATGDSRRVNLKDEYATLLQQLLFNLTGATCSAFEHTSPQRMKYTFMQRLKAQAFHASLERIAAYRINSTGTLPYVLSRSLLVLSHEEIPVYFRDYTATPMFVYHVVVTPKLRHFGDYDLYPYYNNLRALLKQQRSKENNHDIPHRTHP